MKILFSVLPAYGHVYPVLPLALAARDAGHDVGFATNGPFRDKLHALGFEVHDVGLTIEEAAAQLFAELGVALGGSATADGERPDVEIGVRLFLGMLAPRTSSDIAPLLPTIAPDLVVYEQYEFGAAVAAHAAGIPVVCHALSPFVRPEMIAAIRGEHLERLWAQNGVSAPSLDITVGDRYLDIIPDALQLPAFVDVPRRMRMRPVPFTEPGADVPSWIIRRQRPLVYLTLGTVVATDDVLMPVIHGLASLDVDVLVALGSAEGASLGELPDNVHIEAFVDQPAVLRHAELAVHHGGSGTVLGAMLAGVPQLLLPKGADQFENADRMFAAGLADVLEPGSATPGAIAFAAARLLDGTSEHHDAARAEAARKELIALPTPAEVVDALAALYGGRTITSAA